MDEAVDGRAGPTWSWSCALRRSKTVSKSGRASGLSSATATHEHALPLSPPPPLSTRTSAPHTRSDSAETCGKGSNTRGGRWALACGE
eukprot:241691-Chlamydomonas_euryale.AAC.1